MKPEQQFLLQMTASPSITGFVFHQWVKSQ